MSLELSRTADELREAFYALETLEDIATLLEVTPQQLKHHVFVAGRYKPGPYTTFRIPKKSGGTRKIQAPVSALKILQRKLAQALTTVYEPKAPVHGFVPGRSTVSNARVHVGKRYVLNLDLADFFPSINFGRVRGMFMAWPYECSPRVATILARLCCHEGRLPQGSPTSPIVSNMICARMDTQLRDLAAAHRSMYTRYADDLSFSTNAWVFPAALAEQSKSGRVAIGAALDKTIQTNGFAINKKKTRLQTTCRRQEVTGITVNVFPNVRRRYTKQIRAMLHDWATNGLEAAEYRHHREFRNTGTIPPFKNGPSFKQVVKGKIDYLQMVKGPHDATYLSFLYKYAELDETYEVRHRPAPVSVGSGIPAIVYTSGKTDWRHLEHALQQFQLEGKYAGITLHFYKTDAPTGDANLLRQWEMMPKTPKPYPEPRIFVFDADDQNYLNKASRGPGEFHVAGMNVFSFALPVPPHRKDTPRVCIELLYQDYDIHRQDLDGRRLFLSDEFDAYGLHRTDEHLHYINANALKKDKLQVLDSGVIDRRIKRDVALSKIRFADYIRDREPNFEGVDISGFEAVFDVITEIVARASTGVQ